tara:strand:+ start:276 stop:866 length:591 start_codon:yes stop_codon:yes gene_type:complete
VSTQHPLFLSFLKALREGVSDKSSDFHNFVFSNLLDGRVASRHLVIRDFIEKNCSIIFFSDLRSPKIHSILEEKSTTCLFYSKKAELQIRALTFSRIIKDNSLIDSYWESVPIFSRKAYLTLEPPSSKSDEKTDGLPEQYERHANSLSHTSKARKNFCVVENVITELDLLSLSSKGQSRAKFTVQQASIQMDWLVP